MDPFKFEDNLQAALLAGLTTRSIPHGTTRGNTELPQDRVDVRAFGFLQASDQMAQNANGTWFSSHYSGAVAFDVLTQRGGSHAANHNVWVSNIRTMLNRPGRFLNLTNLDCYEVLRVRETQSDPDQEIKTDCDHTALTYAVDLNIIGSSVA